MLQKIQRFGGALFTPVLFFAFSGVVLGITIVLTNPDIVGDFANPEGLPYKFLFIMQDAAWAVFRHMPMLFALGIPLGLAKKANGRAALESFVIFLFFNYFVNNILTFWGPQFGVDFSQPIGSGSGLTEIAGVKTLDMSIVGGILVASIVTMIHDRFYDVKLPDFIGVFQGSVMVAMIGFFVMLPLAFAAAFIWPKVQAGIADLQVFMVTSGSFGVWLYNFLERILIPTGLHHFVYAPFIFGPAVVDGGIAVNWAQSIPEFASSTLPLKELFPAGGFGLHGNAKVFGSIGIALALYATAHKDKKKIVAGLLIPATLTAMTVGITEPLEFTFLFIAPLLFAIHAVLAATMATLMYTFGVVGNMGGGLIEMVTVNWLPMYNNHADTIFTQLVIGVAFIGIYFVVFRTLILKLNLKTPGREEEEEVKLYYKQDYRAKKAGGAPESAQPAKSDNSIVTAYIDALGGPDNIESLTNCATRLRISLYDASRMANDSHIKSLGAHGVVRNKTSIQIIIGLSVPQLREKIDTELLARSSEANTSSPVTV